MYLPELNHISNYRYELNGFGGINRRETADIGEFADAVNLSSEEYPLIMPRKRYDIGTFPKTALMWHNNDRDMALVPALKSDDVKIIDSQNYLIMFVMAADNGRYSVVNTSELGIGISYVTGDTVDGEDPPLLTYELKPGKAYWINKTGWNDNRGCMKGTVEHISDKTYISFRNRKIEIPDVVAFKNPVSANIGTSTVICDEINGMWVLEYDKDKDAYIYNKVQQTYEVDNETHVYNAGTSTAVDTTLVSGGKYCHIRLQYDDVHRPIGELYAINEENLKELSSNSDNVGCLVRLGVDDAALWFRVIGGGLYEPVNKIRIRICIPDAHKCFKVGDYIEITDAKIHFEYPQANEDSSYYKLNEQENIIIGHINGWHEVVNIPMTDGVGWAIDIETDMPHHNFINRMFAERTQFYDGSKPVKSTNDVYMENGMTIKRKAPENVRFICSHMNRIWANNGNNEIMCCARGNPYVWYRYEGNSLDSWAATVGGDGSFTGCVNYGYPLFFKDNRMYRVTGTRPSNFGYDEYSIKGIKSGCHDSAAIVNDVLYYQSIDGIYAYNASTPVCVSEKIYKDWQRGKACRYRDKYYIAVTEDGESKLYCYDTRSGVWHRENMANEEIRYLYPGRYLEGYEEYMTVYADRDEETYSGYTVSSGKDYVHSKEDPVVWSFETTDLLAAEPETKYLKGIYINCRVYPEEENEIELSVQYNGDGEWLSLGDIGPQNGGSRSVWYKYPTAGKRCDNLKIKAEGIGKSVIYNITLEFEKGSTKR